MVSPADEAFRSVIRLQVVVEHLKDDVAALREELGEIRRGLIVLQGDGPIDVGPPRPALPFLPDRRGGGPPPLLLKRGTIKDGHVSFIAPNGKETTEREREREREGEGNDGGLRQ